LGGTEAARVVSPSLLEGFITGSDLPGRLVLASDGENVTYELEADLSRTTDKWRPTIYMERVSRRVELEDEAVSKTWIEKNVEGTTTTNEPRSTSSSTRVTSRRARRRRVGS
jgi:hypothetical protein